MNVKPILGLVKRVSPREFYLIRGPIFRLNKQYRAYRIFSSISYHSKLTMADAVKRWGYSEREIADYLKIHYFTVNRLIRREADSKTSKSKTPHYIEM